MIDTEQTKQDGAACCNGHRKPGVTETQGEKYNGCGANIPESNLPLPSRIPAPHRSFGTEMLKSDLDNKRRTEGDKGDDKKKLHASIHGVSD